MYLNNNKYLNVMILGIITLIVIITLLIFVKVVKNPHPYKDGADITDTYAPYIPWNKAH